MWRFLIVIMLASACSNQDPNTEKIDEEELVFRCLETSTSSVASLIRDCIKHGNPSSDEEPEDLVNMCRVVAQETFCPRGRHVFSNGNWTTVL
jgi:hypothetical protein